MLLLWYDFVIILSVFTINFMLIYFMRNCCMKCFDECCDDCSSDTEILKRKGIYNSEIA